MSGTIRNYCILAMALLAMSACKQPTSDHKDEVRTLIVFFDGLRPDYITPQLMPNLFEFSQVGSYGKNHHSVFPTVTRVNASSYATGSYPATHGILGNTVYFPEVDEGRALNTGDHTALDKIAEATHGHLLTAVSLGEALQKAGARMMVFSSGSTGQALLQNHNISGGAIINTDMIRPDSIGQSVIDEVGPIPPSSKPNTARHQWITDALIRYGLRLDGPLVSAIWFSDPDGAAHADGIGSDAAVEALKSVDTQFGRILTTLKEKKLTQNFNIIISSDHGFITNVGKQGLQDFLISEGFKKGKESRDVVVAGGALYIENHDPDVIRKIVSRLQAQPWVGAIFTRAKSPGDAQGIVEGTLSFETIHWNHPQRSADILVDENWDDTRNDKGYAGTSYSRGVAGHGGLSPYEVHIALLASGPSFKSNFESELPTSNVDIAPTVLSIHNIAIPSTMSGRVMSELLTGGKGEGLKAKKEQITSSTSIPGGTYTVTLQRTVLDEYQYVDFAKVERTAE